MPNTQLVLDAETGNTSVQYQISAAEMVRNDPATYSIVPDSLRRPGEQRSHLWPWLGNQYPQGVIPRVLAPNEDP